MTLWRYTTIAAVTGGLSYLALATQLEAPAQRAAGLGVLLATLNTIASHGLATWANGRSQRAFMLAVLGGMSGRMAALLGGLLVAVLRFGFPLVPLAVALLGLFVPFLIFELAVLLWRTSPEHATR